VNDLLFSCWPSYDIMAQVLSSLSLFNYFLALLAFVVSQSTAAPYQHGQSVRTVNNFNFISNGTKCTDPKMRIEW
jgi:hypothetical protein